MNQFSKTYKILTIIILLFCLVTPKYSTSQNWYESQKMVANDRGLSDYFGSSVCIWNKSLIVGSPFEDENVLGSNSLSNAGSAYFLSLDSNNNWNQTQKIIPWDRHVDDFFGNAVAISGNYAIIGAYKNDTDASFNWIFDAGAAYIFEKDTNGIWNQVQKLTASDRNFGDYFGYSVAIDSNYAAIGIFDGVSNNNNPTGVGGAYIFKRDSLGSWNEIQKVIPSDGQVNDLFGLAIDIAKGTLIVGSKNGYPTTFGSYKISAGAVYIFEEDSLGIWNEKQKITGSDRAAYDQFGASISISNETILVGANGKGYNPITSNVNSLAGAAYFFMKNNDGDWIETKKILPSDVHANDQFGISVSISENNAVIGAYAESENEVGMDSLTWAGSAYFLTKDNFGEWHEAKKVIASDRAPHDWFGNAVSISGNNTIIGAYRESENESGTNTLSSAGSIYYFYNSGISSRVFLDLNNNCLFDSSENPIPSRNITISPGNIILQTNSEGYWHYPILPVGNYSITIDTSGNLIPTCFNSLNFSISNIDSNVLVTPIGLISNLIVLENNLEDDVLIYPNPTARSLKIEFEQTFTEISVQVLHTDGKVVLNKQLINRNKLNLDLTSLPDGIYIVKLKADDKNTVLRVIKQR